VHREKTDSIMPAAGSWQRRALAEERGRDDRAVPESPMRSTTPESWRCGCLTLKDLGYRSGVSAAAGQTPLGTCAS